MDINRFIENVNSVDWHKFDYTELSNRRYDGIYSFAQTVPTSLIALALVDKESDELLYIEGLERFGLKRTDFIANAPIDSNIKFAIGNEHRGTYYPIILEVLPFIVEVALLGNHVVSRTCAINTLIDLYHFYPDDGSEEMLNFVKKTIEDVIVEHRENFIKFAESDMRNKTLIEDLLCIVEEQE